MGLGDALLGMASGALGKPSAPGAGGKAILNVEGIDGDDGRWELQFNPTSLRVSKSASWTGDAADKADAPVLSYKSSSAATISFSFYLDVTRVPLSKGKTPDSVDPATKRLWSLVKPGKDLPDFNGETKTGAPPKVYFQWGAINTFWAAVTSLNIEYTYFSRDGKPLRAKVDMTLTQVKPEEDVPLQNPTSHTPYPHTVRYVVPGETLDRIAARRYGDPTRWRAIAIANDIANPFELDPARPLIIPDDPGVVGV